MFLAEWSGRRVAAHALTWLVGFPVVMAAVTIVAMVASTRAEMRGFPRASSREQAVAERVTYGPPGALRAARDSAWRDSARRDTLAMAARMADGGTRQLAFLPPQPEDVVIGVDAGAPIGPVPGWFLWSWLLPPALLVAAWLWTRRSRAEPE